VDFHPVKRLHFENSFSIVYGQNKEVNEIKLNDDSKYLPFTPPFHSISELRYDFDNKAHHIVKGFIKAQMIYYARQDRVYLADNTETPTPGYALFNIGIGSGFTNKKGKTICNLYVMANNLFDVAYYDHLSRLKYFLYSPTDTDPAHGIHNMGRNIAFRFEFPLDFHLTKEE
jgi:iron complex outermembrane receptor protein